MLRNVVRLHHEKIRLVYDGIGYFADAYSKGKDFVAMVLEKDERINEIGVEVTLAIGLIRKEKFELVLQKACELGVTRIVPFESMRCVVRAKKKKKINNKHVELISYKKLQSSVNVIVYLKLHQLCN